MVELPLKKEEKRILLINMKYYLL